MTSHTGDPHPFEQGVMDMDTLNGVKIPSYVLQAAGILRDAGYEANLVGGCVRDMIMGRVPNDYDIATNALPGEMMAVFDHAVPTGARFGTVTAVIMEGDSSHTLEITAYRSEGAYADGRHPGEVAFGVPLAEDLSRRDFTMNAMALNPFTLELTDLFDGRRDLGSKVIRAVGSPGIRFAEDKLRMLRAVRFAATLGFGIDGGTLEGIRALAPEIKVVSTERITEELGKLLLAPVPSIGIELLRETGLLVGILPELLWGWGMEQNKYHAFTVYYHTLKCLDQVPPTPLLRWAALLHDVGKPPTKEGEHFYGHEKVGAGIAEEILLRLKLPSKLARDAVHLIRNHMVGYSDKWKDAAVRRFISRVGKDYMEDLLALHTADMGAKGTTPDERQENLAGLKERVRRELQENRPTLISDLAVTGDDIAGFLGGPGPKVGMILKELLQRVLDEPGLNNRKDLMNLAKGLGIKGKGKGKGR